MNREPATDDYLKTHTVGELEPLSAPIRIVEYDPAWPHRFAREAGIIRSALGDRALLVEHAGSTSVPGLPAKPIVDIVLAVTDSTGESTYAPPLQRAGYHLRIREPDWYEHRMFRGAHADVNLHVFSSGCPEIARMLLFRDWLRTHPADRDLYAAAKRQLAGQDWKYTQNYADAKTGVIEQILSRARA